MLTETQRNIIIETLKPYNPTRIGISALVACGEAKDESDIDILYTLKDEISLFQHIRIQKKLQEFITNDIDLISESALNPYLKESILNDLLIIYKAG
jgi:predicted nucleotidyltransferase